MENDTSAGRFEQRLRALEEDLTGIQKELARRNLIELVSKTRRMVRSGRNLLDSNINVLFPVGTEEVRGELHSLLSAADQQLHLALAQDYDFEVIMQRLYMASSLAEYVLQVMSQAVEELRRQNRV